MSFTEKLRNIVLIILGQLCALGFLIYGIKTSHTKYELPTVIKQTLPFVNRATPQPLPKMGITKVVPFPNEVDISTYPTIAADFLVPVSNQVSVTIEPTVPFDLELSNEQSHLVIKLKAPLQVKTPYSITLEDGSGSYSWRFTTGDIAVSKNVIIAIARIQEQLPYKDPNGQFAIYYAPQTDVYFITVHNDERSVAEMQAALTWLRSQGITDEKSLHITWQASEAF